MSNQSKAEDTPAQSTNGQEERNVVARGRGYVDAIKEQYRKTKEHAETYPYVWASYILVYGGFGLWFTYRFRKLRQLEDRVRILQKEILEQYEAEEAAESAKVMQKSTKSSIKPLLPADIASAESAKVMHQSTDSIKPLPPADIASAESAKVMHQSTDSIKPLPPADKAAKKE